MLVWILTVSVAAGTSWAAPLSKSIQDSVQNGAIIFPNTTVQTLPHRNSFDHATYPRAIKAINYGAARLLKLTLEQNHDNWLISPISLAAMLGQLMLGAKGHLRRTLGEILTPGRNISDGPPSLEVHKELGGLLKFLQSDIWSEYVLYVAGALFMHPNIDLKSAYKHALPDIYNLKIIKTDFTKDPKGSMDKINSWVDKATFGKINNVLNEPAPSSTAVLYINAVYFKGSWKTPFDPTLTRPGNFNVNKTYQVGVEYMAGEVEVKYIEDPKSKCKMIGLPYEGSTIFAYIFLPDKEDTGSHYRLYDLAADLTPDRMSELIAAAQLNNITVILPKVKLSTTISLRRPMVQAIQKTTKIRRDVNRIRGARTSDNEQELSKLFSNSIPADVLPLKIDEASEKDKRVTFNMGSASDDYRFRIDDLVHKVQLEMSESGIEAVAVTSTLVDYFGTILFRVDRPFLFMIRHEITGAQLFWGAIYNPASL